MSAVYCSANGWMVKALDILIKRGNSRDNSRLVLNPPKKGFIPDIEYITDCLNWLARRGFASVSDTCTPAPSDNMLMQEFWVIALLATSEHSMFRFVAACFQARSSLLNSQV